MWWIRHLISLGVSHLQLGEPHLLLVGSRLLCYHSDIERRVELQLFFISLRKPGVHVPRHVMAWHGRHIVTCGTSPEQEGYHQGIGNYNEFLKDVGWLRICSKCLSTLMVVLNYGDHRRILYHRLDTPPWCISPLCCFSHHRLSSILIAFSRLPLSIWLIIEIKAHTFKL